MNQIYLVIGCPGVGKSWVCNQLRELYEYVRHDDYIQPNAYLAAIVRQAKIATKPLLIETPFSVSQVKEPLEKHGYQITPIFIIEEPDTIRQRYRARENKPIPEGHITRQGTYLSRAIEWQAFRGSSEQALTYLRKRAPTPKFPWD